MAGNAMDVYRQALAQSRKKDEITPGGNAGGDADEGQQGGFFKRAYATTVDVRDKVARGMLSSLEGIGDFFYGVNNYLNPLPAVINSIAGREVIDRDAPREFIEKDLTGSFMDWGERLVGKDRLMEQSFQKQGGVAQQVEYGIGGMLPSVAAAALTGGASTAAQIGAQGAAKLGEAASLAVLGVGAAGQGTQEAYRDGAGNYAGLAYGAAEGAKEVLTEKIFDAPMEAFYGSGFLDPVMDSISGKIGSKAGRTVGRLAKTFVGEGIEEAAGEAAEPFLQAIYKGKDAFEGVTVGSQLEEMGKSFAMGGLTALAFSGTVGYGVAKASGQYTGKEANAAEIVEDIEAQKKKLANVRRDMDSPTYGKRRQQVADRTVALYDELRDTLQSMSEQQRARMIRELSLDKAFTPEGEYTDEMLKRVKDGAGVDERYISASADAWAVKEAADKVGAVVVQGELDEAQRASYEAVRAVENALGEQSGGTLSFGLVESLGDSEGLFARDGNVILIPKETLTTVEDAGKLAADFAFRKIIHEASHFTEGTSARADVVNQISLEDRGSRSSLFASLRGDSAFDRALDEVARRGYVRDADGNELTGERARAEVERLMQAQDLSESEQGVLGEIVDEVFSFMTESALGTKHFADRLLSWRPGVLGNLISRLHDAAERLGASGKDGTRAAVARMQGLERSFLRSVEEAGMAYEDGEIVGIRDEEEDEDGEETRKSRKTTSEDKMMDTEGNELTREQREFFKESKIRDENGRLRVVYHGTNEDFTVFNQDFIGMASGDSGYFGKGFYFAYTEGEAEYYGSRNIIKAYLNIERPFDFRKEFHTYNGERAEIGKGPDMVALINLSEKFPDIGKKVKISAQKNGHNFEFTANDLGTLFRRFMQDKTFMYGEESDAEGNTYVTVKADPKEFKETINGNEFSWTEYEYEGEFATKPNTLDTVSDYIASKVFDRIRVPNFTQVILDNNTEFTDELKKRGYDGTIQSEEGDEACAFYSEQIKNVTNKKPTKNPDIRYSRKVTAEQDAAYMEAVEAGDMETAQKMVEEAAYNANYIVKGYHGTPNGGFTVFGGKKTRNGAPEAGSYWFTEDEAHAEAYRTYTEWGRMAENPQTYKVYLKIGEWAPIGNGRVEALDYNRDGAGAATKELKDVAKQIVLRTGFKHRNESERTRITRVTKRLTEIAREIYADNVWQVTETKQFAELCKQEGLSAVMAVEEDKGTWGGERRMVKTWGVFDNSQIKSAEPVVYDDNGNVIPLSERFDEKKSDIRWSKKAKGTTPVNENTTEEEMKNRNPWAYKEALDALEYAKENGQQDKPLWRLFDFYDSIERDAGEFNDDQTVREKALDAVGKAIAAGEATGSQGRRETVKSGKKPKAPTPEQMAIAEKRRAEIREQNRKKVEEAEKVLNRFAARSVYGLDESTEAVKGAMDVAVGLLYEEPTDVSLGMEPIFKRYMDKKAADRLFMRFNSIENESQARAVCDEIADMILANTSVRQTYATGTVQEAAEYVDVLKGYRHKLDLAGIEGDLRAMYDDRYRDVMRDWRKKEGGIAVDAVKADIEERLGVVIDAENPADIFAWIVDNYQTMRDRMTAVVSKLAEAVTGDYWQSVRKSVSDTLMDKYRSGGKITSVHEILMDVDETRGRMERENALYKRLFNEMKEELEAVQTEVERQRALNKAAYLAQEIRHWKTGEFEAASEVGNQQALPIIQSLSKVVRAGNVSGKGVRVAMRELSGWYGTDAAKEFLGCAKDKDGNWYGKWYNGEVEQKMQKLGQGEGNLTLEEAKDLCDALQFFHKLVEDFHKVRIDGKRMDAAEYSEKMQKVIGQSRNVVSDRTLGQVLDVYLEEFADPMTVARYFDGYNENGFLTQWMQRFRNAEFTTDLYRHDLTMQITEFLDEHPKYLKEAEKRGVDVGIERVPVMVAMYLELALLREQAVPHLMVNGFVYKGFDGKERNEGLGNDMDNKSEASMKRKAESIAREIHSQLSEADKQFLAIAIKLFNQDCRNLKAQTDRERFGYTNVEDGMYIPIRISDELVRVDKGTYSQEIDRATNASFNKNVQKGARNKVVAGNLYEVLTQHIDGVARYAGLSEAIADFEQVLNINTSTNPGDPVTIRRALEDVWGARKMKAFGGRSVVHGAVAYMTGLIEDIQRIHTNDATTMVDGFVGWLRGKYAVSVLGANPKVLLTQFSSLFASTAILDAKHVARAFAMQSERDEIDKYCKLAMLRDANDSAAKAMTLVDEVTSKIGELSMSLIGKMDRTVVAKLWTACRLQEAERLKVAFDSEECKVAAGSLLTRVIYETQQNSQMTERSYAMRSESSLAKVFTMFSADAMKTIGRVIDAVGKVKYIRGTMRTVSDPAMIENLKGQLEDAKHQQAKALGALLSGAAYMAVITMLVRKLLARDDDDTFESWSKQDIWQFLGDMLGSCLGGLPVIKEAAELFGAGYEVSDVGVETFNNLLTSVNGIKTVLVDAVQGKATEQDVAKSLRSIVYSVSAAYGLPVRNVFKWLHGLGYYITPETVARVDSVFTNKSYTSALAEAIDSGNDRRAEMIASIMVDQKDEYVESGAVRREMIRLAAAGQAVLPQVLGDTITYDGEQYELKARQRKAFKAVYAGASEAAEKMVATKYYKSMDDEAKAKAIKRVYSMYWNLGIEEVLGVDIESKALYMAKAIPAEKLACIAAQASSITSDRDAAGKVVAGSKKAKVAAFVQGLQLSAAQKYLIFGYLGYENKAGEIDVRRYVQSLRASIDEKNAIMKAAGY